MPRTGKAVVAHGQSFDVREYNVPDPAPGTVLLRQELAGICGTDLHNWQKSLPKETMMGHEAVGIIEALGKGVSKDYLGNPIREGDRLVFHPRNSGIAYGFRGTDEPFTGGFADYIYLSDTSNCFIKSSAPPEVGVLAEPFAVGVHAAMRAGPDRRHGDHSGVWGDRSHVPCGCQDQRRGAVDRHRRPSRSAGTGEKLGAHITIDIGEVRDVAERKDLVLSHTAQGAGANVVFECAGFLPAFPEGLEYVAEDGTFVEVGHFVDMGTIEVNPNRHFLRPNLRLEGIWGSRYPHFVRGVAILENMEFPFGEMVSHQLPLERIGDGFNALNGSYRLGNETVIKVALRS